MSSYNSTIEDIKSRLSIVDVISEYVSLKKSGQNYKGLCPFHSEKTPSFMVSPSKQIYHCFGCGAGGDVFTFLAKYETLSFGESVEFLAKKAGVTLKKTYSGNAGKEGKELILAINNEAALFYQRALYQNPAAIEYLKKRGIGADAQRVFQIGYAPAKTDALIAHLKNKGYKADDIRKAGLISSGVGGFNGTFRHRIMFPIFDLKGGIIAFGGRIILSGQPKYLNSPETQVFNKGSVLYGINIAKESVKRLGYALIAEGYIDVIALHIYGFSNAVAPLGTAITEGHGKLLKRFVDNAILVFDGDEAGVRAASNAIGILFEGGLNVKVLPMPQGEDPDSFLRHNGKEAFNALLEKALNIVDFFLMQNVDKTLAARRTLEAVSKAPDKILQGHYIKRLSERLGIDEVFVMEEFKKVTRGERGRKIGKAGPPHAGTETALSKKPLPLEETYILQILLNFPEASGQVFAIISEGDFKNPLTKAIFKKMKDITTHYDALLVECEEAEKGLLTEISFKADITDYEKVLGDCLNRFKSKKQKVLLQEIQEKIREAEAKKDIGMLRALQIEQQRLLSQRNISSNL